VYNICRNLQLWRGLVLRYSFGSGRGATVEFTAALDVSPKSTTYGLM